MNVQIIKLIDKFDGRWKKIAFASFGVAFLLIVASALSYTVFVPSTTSEDLRTKVTTQEVSTSAVVTNNMVIYDKGEVVKESSLYVLSTMPEVTIRAHTKLPSEVKQAKKVSQTFSIRYYGKYKENVFWSNVKRYESETTTTSNTATANATIDMREVKQYVLDVQNAYNNRGTLHANLIVTSTFTYQDGTKETIQTKMPIHLSDNTYSIGSGNAQTKTTSPYYVKETTKHPMKYSKFGFAGAVIFLILGLGGLRARTFADESRTQVDYKILQHDDWISQVQEHPKQSKDVVEYSSVDDIVDSAIDSEKRVLQSGTQTLFFRDEEELHIFTTELSPSEYKEV